MDAEKSILINKLADKIYKEENMTIEEFWRADLHTIVKKYGVDEDLIDNVVADLVTYYDF